MINHKTIRAKVHQKSSSSYTYRYLQRLLR